MLNRLTESFYWTGRYMERADYMTRLIDVNYHAHHLLLEIENHQEDLRRRLLSILGESSFKGPLLDFLTFDTANNNSILACLKKARQNVRMTREHFPEKVWDTINSFYLWFKEQDEKNRMQLVPYSFYKKIRQEVLLFQAVTDATMLHGYEWNFVQAGKYIERTENSIRILQLFCSFLAEDRDFGHEREDYQRMISILECVDGFEAFRKCHANQVKLEKVFEFLTLNKSFPRSLSFSFKNMKFHLNLIEKNVQGDRFSSVNRAVARMKTSLLAAHIMEDSSIDEIQSFLNELLMNCNQLSFEMENCFFRGDGGEFSGSAPQRKVKVV